MRVTTVAALFVLTGRLNAQNNSLQILSSPFPYEFPDEHNAGSSSLFPMSSCNGVTLEEATIDQLQDYMKSGRVTSVQLVDCYVQKYYKVNGYIKYVNLQI